MVKNLLITGGSGFIGSNYINHIFHKEEYDNIINLDALYYCADNNNIEKKIKNSPKYHFIKGSVCDYKLLIKILTEHNITHIIHFAAQSHVDNSFNESLKYTNDNVLGTHTLLESIKNTNKNIILLHFSTDEVYGESDLDDLEKTEDSILCPTNPYAASKAAAEMYIRSYIYSFDLKIIISRGNNIFGKNQYPEKLIPKFIKQLKENKKCTIHGKGDSIRNFVHVDDVCNGIDLIIDNGSFGQIYNIGNDISGEKSVLEITKYLIKKIKNTDNYDEYINYVEDRPFNDKRYLISNTKLKNLGWNIEKKFYNEIDNLITNYISNDTYGFIILLRDSNKYYDLYNEIRKHTSSEIIFICYENFDNRSDINLVNTKIIINEFDFNNNLISYYYFFVNKYFDKAIIIDDNVSIDIVKKCIDLVQKNDFINISKKNIETDMNESNMLEFLTKNISNSEKKKLVNLYNQKNLWKGCNRLLSISNYNNIKLIQEKYTIFNYLKNLNYDNFNYLENIFGFLMYYHTKS